MRFFVHSAYDYFRSYHGVLYILTCLLRLGSERAEKYEKLLFCFLAHCPCCLGWVLYIRFTSNYARPSPPPVKCHGGMQRWMRIVPTQLLTMYSTVYISGQWALGFTYLNSGKFVSLLADLGQKSSVLCMLLCLKRPINWISKVDNRG